VTNQEINEQVFNKLGHRFAGEGPHLHGDPKPCYHYVPNYCTDIAAAWEIVEFVSRKLDPNGDVKETAHPDGRMRFVGYGFRLEHHCENIQEKWICFFPEIVCAPPYEEMNDDIQAEADTAPMAICLAFLSLKQ